MFKSDSGRTVAAAVGPARAAETQQAIYAAADLAGDANA